MCSYPNMDSYTVSFIVIFVRPSIGVVGVSVKITSKSLSTPEIQNVRNISLLANVT